MNATHPHGLYNHRCACGCGGAIPIRNSHARHGIPRFLVGHHTRIAHWNAKGLDAWVAEQRDRHRCACGCGAAIVVQKRHHSRGIPRFAPGHQPPPRVGPGPAHPRYRHDRSAMKPRRAAAFPEAVRNAAIREADGRCAWCGSEDATQLDHVIAVADGGAGDLANAQILCANCHWWKSGIAQRPPRAPKRAPTDTRKETAPCP
jgi:5-methylcytosine-specific restriction endonuclease McrA